LNCRDAERLLDAFFDGELDGRLMRDAALHVTRCKRCESEVGDRERLQELLVAAVDDEVSQVDVGRVWQGVAAAIGSSAADRGARSRRGAGRRNGADHGWLRLAAASSRSTGWLIGRRAPARTADDGGFDESLDPAGEWLAREAPRSASRSWPLAAGAALAASLVAALLVGRGDAPVGDAPVVPQIASAPTAPSRAEPASARMAMAKPAASQVQVESVDYSGGRSLAMWTEPETDTTVIWVDDEDPTAPKPTSAR